MAASLASLAALVAGALLGALLGYALGLITGLALPGSDREGRRATLAAFAFGPAGALIGTVLGAWFAPPAGPLALVVPALALAVAGLILRQRARRPLGLNRAAPRLHIEVETPAPLRAVTLLTDRNSMPASLGPHDGKRQSATVELYHRTRRRALRLDPGPEVPLPLAAAPANSDWSGWQPLGEGLRLRWRVSGA